MTQCRMPLHRVETRGSERVSAIYWDRVAGLSFAEIARKHGVSRDRARQAFQQHVINRRNAREELEEQVAGGARMRLKWSLTDEELERLCEMYPRRRYDPI